VLARIRARRAAINYPWRPGNDGGSIVCGPEAGDDPDDHRSYYGGDVVCESVSGADKTFIIHAANDIDWLIARCAHKMTVREALRVMFCCGLMGCGILFCAAFVCGWGWRLAQ
jgi:hypothetical protein